MWPNTDEIFINQVSFIVFQPIIEPMTKPDEKFCVHYFSKTIVKMTN